VALSIGELVGYVGLDTSAAEDASEKLGGYFEGMGGKWGMALGGAGLVAGGLFAASLSGAMGDEVSLDKLSASLGLSEAESERIGGVAGNLYANAYGESLDEVSEAVGSVMKNIDGMASASSGELEGVTGKVMDLVTAFDQDLGMTTAAVGQMIRTGMAKDANEALDMLTKGLQGPANKADDLMETMNEYGTQFRKMGLDGTEAMGLLSQGLKGGARDADIVADSIKEFSLRATGELLKTTQTVDGPVASLTALGEAFKAAGYDANGSQKDFKAAMDLQDDLAAGGERAKAGLQIMLEGLRATENPLERSRNAVALFGTQAEDMGDALYKLDLDTAAKEVGKVGGAADAMSKTLADNASTNITAFTRTIRQGFVETLGGTVLPIVTEATGLLVSSLAPAFDMVGDAVKGASDFIGEHKGVLSAVAGLIAAVFIPHLVAMGVTSTITAAKTVAAWVVTQAGAVAAAAVHSVAVLGMVGGWVLMGVQSMLAAAKVAAAWLLAMGPIGLVIAAVVGLVVLIVKNWDTIVDATGKAWDWVSSKVSDAWDATKTAVSAGIAKVVSWVTAVPGKLATGLSTLVSTVRDLFADAFHAAKDKATTIVENIALWLLLAPGKIATSLGGLVGTVRDLFRDAMEAGKEKVTGIGTTIVEWIAGIPGKMLNKLGAFGDAGRQLLQGFVDGMKNAAGVIEGIAGNVWEAVRGLLNGAIAKINAALEFTINLPGPKDLTVDIPNIPQLATGGRATNATLAVIGEGREPESVLPDSVLRGLLERAHAAGAAVGGGGGGRGAPLIGQAIMQPGASVDDFAEALWFKTRTRG